jgi:hypothetical protein
MGAPHLSSADHRDVDQGSGCAPRLRPCVHHRRCAGGGSAANSGPPCTVGGVGAWGVRRTPALRAPSGVRERGECGELGPSVHRRGCGSVGSAANSGPPCTVGGAGAGECGELGPSVHRRGCGSVGSAANPGPPCTVGGARVGGVRRTPALRASEGVWPPDEKRGRNLPRCTAPLPPRFVLPHRTCTTQVLSQKGTVPGGLASGSKFSARGTLASPRGGHWLGILEGGGSPNSAPACRPRI